jgi:16S rRNA (adenine1518-N6/adenine1519-N6)-dimethyltransferase
MEERLRPRKSLGQNFLVDDNIARKIVRAADINADDVVVEIGPGKGALTKHLLEEARRVIAVELDERAVKHLKEEFESVDVRRGLEILHADILSQDLYSIARKAGKRLRVIGNIPYYITTPILFRILEQRSVVQDLIMLVQLEVGRRIVARPRTKDYGILSVFCQFYGMPRLLFKVPPTAFSPRPGVFSVLLRLDFPLKPKYKVQNEEIFAAIVRATFGKRRKTLRNGLRYLGVHGLDLVGLPFDLSLRPEELSVEQFIVLANLIEERLHASSAA